MHHNLPPATSPSPQDDIDQPCPADVLSDDELAAHGFVKIQAFTRAPSSLTGSATRSKRAREKAAASGARQLNVTAPLEAHPLLRDIAKELQAGSTLSDVLRNALTIEVQKTDPCAVVTLTAQRNVVKAEAAGQRPKTLELWKRLVTAFLAIRSMFFRP